MDSSPVDAAWDTEEADAAASDPPPASEDHRAPLQVIADLRHPHLIVMHRNAEGSGFERELAGGMSLAELSRSEAGWFPLPLRVGLRILLDSLSGLAEVHQATKNGNAIHFVHGEVAPSNIIVGRDGVGRLVPVVPAHWNEAGSSNPDVTGYIAPERLLGDVFGQPADVFSAGVLLWEAITGKPLFRNWPLDAIVTQLIGRKVPYPIPFGDALWGVPLADVAMRALSVDPAERWAHVGALGAQIENIARGHLASSDEIAALVAGFAAGRGHSSAPPAVTAPLPAPSAPSIVTSLSPTASSIQSPSDSQPMEAVEAVEAPAAEAAPIAERWESRPSAAPRIWLPTQEKTTTTERSIVAPAPAEVADSWSGIAPASAPSTSRRAKIAVAAALAASVTITAGAAYQLLDRNHESNSTATVLAPKVAAPAPPSPAAATTEAARAPLGTPPSTAAPVTSADPAAPQVTGRLNESATKVPGAPTSITGSAPSVASPPVISNRPAQRPASRSAPPQAPPAAVTAGPKAAPAPSAAPPAPAAKPKPKEDLFGI
jgi:eukaryotic-like serine/threonine-protein kinase